MKTITRVPASTRQFRDEVNQVERSGIRGKRSYVHKADTQELTNLPRSVNAVSAQISVLLNRIRTESSR